MAIGRHFVFLLNYKIVFFPFNYIFVLLFILTYESSNYDRLTQNRKLHKTVVTDCFRKKSPLTVTFHSTNISIMYQLILCEKSLRVIRWVIQKNKKNDEWALRGEIQS